ncbi:MAG: hypothetical protein QXF88_01355 [Candidatus Aenigmatarchaeota archaeon]
MEFEIYRISDLTGNLLSNLKQETHLSDDPKVVFYPKGTGPNIDLDNSLNIKRDTMLYVSCLSHPIITGENKEIILDVLKKCGCENPSLVYLGKYCDEKNAFLE